SVEICAAVDVHDLAVDVGRLIRGKKERGVGDVVGCRGAAYRGVFFDRLAQPGGELLAARAGEEVGGHQPRGDGIAGDSIRTQLPRRGVAQPDHAGFAGRVVSCAKDAAALFAGDAADPDDAAAAALHHPGQHRLQADEPAAQVHVEYQVELVELCLPD